MIKLKTQEEIEILAEGGAILAGIMRHLRTMVKPGVSTAELDAMAIELAKKSNAEPSFLGYTTTMTASPYPAALCTSINDEIVHAMGNLDRKLKEGDIVGLDMGLKYKNLYTDMAITVPVGKINSQAAQLVEVTQKALMKGINQIKPGNPLSAIGVAIDNYVQKYGYGIIKELVGHGVGYAVHEEPAVPNYKTSSINSLKLKEGLVIAIEPMLTMGDWQVHFDDDGWTTRTTDGSLSAHFEHTVAVTKDGYRIITQ